MSEQGASHGGTVWLSDFVAALVYYFGHQSV